MCNQCSQALIQHLKDKDPVYWHQIAWNYNWDNGIKPLEWIINQPECDKATALLIFWRAGPRWYSQYQDESEVDKYLGRDQYRLINSIKDKYESGFYETKNIFFDPANDEGHDWTKDNEDIEMKVKIPKEMYKSTQGKKLEKQPIPEGMPEEVVKSIHPK